MNIAAIAELYKSVNPPVFADHVAAILCRVDQQLRDQEQRIAARQPSESKPDTPAANPNDTYGPSYTLMEQAIRLAAHSS